MKQINGKLKPDNNFKWKFRKQLLAACFFLLVCITGITAAAKGMTEDAGTNQTERIPGCGLADTAYSYDGGKTWTSDSFLEVAGNGTYEVMVMENGQLVLSALLPETIANRAQAEREDNDEA